LFDLFLGEALEHEKQTQIHSGDLLKWQVNQLDSILFGFLGKDYKPYQWENTPPRWRELIEGAETMKEHIQESVVKQNQSLVDGLAAKLQRTAKAQNA